MTDSLYVCTPDDHQMVEDIIFESFHQDPHVSWMIDKKNDYDSHLRKLISVSLYICLPKKTVFMDHEKRGVAVWISSDFPKFTLKEDIQFVKAIWHVTSFKHFFKVISFVLKTKNKYPKQPGHYLFYLAVKNKFQGQGVGSLLLRGSMDQLKKSSTTFFLETANKNNLPVYQKHGFNVGAVVADSSSDHQVYVMHRS